MHVIYHLYCFGVRRPTFNSSALPRAQDTEADHLAGNHNDQSPDPPPASHRSNVRLLEKLLLISHRKGLSWFIVVLFILPLNGSVVYNDRIGCVKSKQQGFSNICVLITLAAFRNQRTWALNCELKWRCRCVYTMYICDCLQTM